MKAIILAAGQGKRMGIDKPKCLLEFGGKTLLQRQIDTFRECGISDIVVVVGYKNNVIPNCDFTMVLNENFRDTNMVYSLFLTPSYWSEDIIVSYGDIIYEKNALIKLIRSKGCINVVMDINGVNYFKKRFENEYMNYLESMKTDSFGKIVDIGSSVSNDIDVEGQYIGLMKFTTKGLARLYVRYHQNRKKYRNSYMTDLFRDAISDGIEIGVIKIKSGWLEFDTLNDYTLYNKWIKDGIIKKYINLEEN